MPIPVPPNQPPGLFITAQDLIGSSLRLINVLAQGETLSAEDGNDGLISLNQMVDSWQAQRLMIFAELRQVFSLSSGKQTYTMGIDPSGANTADFNVPRPAKIDHMSVLQINSTPQPIELPLDYITDDQWANIPVKNVTSSLPQQCWDDQQYPFRNLNFWPIPNTLVDAVIYSWQQISQFVDLGSTRYSFPPGYMAALRFSLAEVLAPEYGALAVEALPAVANQAQKYRDVIEAMNAQLIDIRVDPALINYDQGIYNYYSDTPIRR